MSDKFNTLGRMPFIILTIKIRDSDLSTFEAGSWVRIENGKRQTYYYDPERAY